MCTLTFPLFLRRAQSNEILGVTGTSLCPIFNTAEEIQLSLNLLYLYFRFLGGNKIKKISEGAFDNSKNLEIMYVRE